MSTPRFIQAASCLLERPSLSTENAKRQTHQTQQLMDARCFRSSYKVRMMFQMIQYVGLDTDIVHINRSIFCTCTQSGKILALSHQPSCKSPKHAFRCFHWQESRALPVKPVSLSASGTTICAKDSIYLRGSSCCWAPLQLWLSASQGWPSFKSFNGSQLLTAVGNV